MLHAVAIPPPEGDAAVHCAHDDLEENDQTDLHVQEAVEGACVDRPHQVVSCTMHLGDTGVTLTPGGGAPSTAVTKCTQRIRCTHDIQRG